MQLQDSLISQINFIFFLLLDNISNHGWTCARGRNKRRSSFPSCTHTHVQEHTYTHKYTYTAWITSDAAVVHLILKSTLSLVSSTHPPPVTKTVNPHTITTAGSLLNNRICRHQSFSFYYVKSSRITAGSQRPSLRLRSFVGCWGGFQTKGGLNSIESSLKEIVFLILPNINKLLCESKALNWSHYCSQGFAT